MYQMLIRRNIRDAFSNVEVLLCKYLTLMISNCTYWRAKIKDEHQCTMNPSRLAHLTMLRYLTIFCSDFSSDKKPTDFVSL